MQAGQIAASGPMAVATSPDALARMTKPSPDTSAGVQSMASMRARRRRLKRQATGKFPPVVASHGGPTPAPSLRTQPVKPSSFASRQTKGRKPTP
jgi:hypothetical protein